MKLWHKILMGLGAGVLLGFLLHAGWLPSNRVAQLLEALQLVGSLFMRAIQMVLPLLVFAAMAVGIINIPDMQKVGRMGSKILFLFLSTTVAAIWIGFGFGLLFEPGKDMHLVGQRAVATKMTATSFGQNLLHVIPASPMEALAQGNTLQILFFAFLFGLAVHTAGTRAKPIADGLQALAHVMYQLIGMVMRLAPYGVFAMMAWVVGSFGWSVLQSLLHFILTIYLASFAHIFLIYGGMLLLVGLPLWPFFRGMKEAILFAFSSSSSSATLPTSLVCAQKNLGVSARMANFILPLGAAINMNGTALFHALAAVFISQAYHIPLCLSDYLIITVIATLSSIGTAGAPGSGLVILSTVLVAIGLPLEAIGLLLGIDRLRDMIGTVVNILGDAIITVFIAKKEGEIDEEVYRSKHELVESDH